MEIISLSLDSSALAKIEQIQDVTNFQGRSELVRTAIDTLHRDTFTLDDYTGAMNAVIVARHQHRHEGAVSDISHGFGQLINTQLHSNLKDGNCLEIFHVDGTAARIKSFYNELAASKQTESVNILPQQ